MEQWQIDYLTKESPRLLTNTKCGALFLSVLKARSVVGLSDLELIRGSTGDIEQAGKMYDIIVTRRNAYEVTVEALHKTNQTGALRLLIRGYYQHGITPPFSFAWQYFDLSSDDSMLFDAILSKYIRVQGKKFLLHDLFKEYDKTRLRKLFQDTIDEKTFLNIINENQDFNLIRRTIPDIQEFYIKRTLRERSRIKLDALNYCYPDVFLLKGVTVRQLTKWVYPKIVESSSKQLECITVRHIVCNIDQDYHTICKHSGSRINIHFLESKDYKLRWIRSHGSFNALLQYVHETQALFEEEAFVKHINKDSMQQLPVCISDTPGMGKTVLLNRLAQTIHVSHPKTLILYFELPEFVQRVSSRFVDEFRLKDLISSKLKTTKFSKQLVLQILNSHDHRVEIFFDGYDEVLTSQLATTKNILTTIRDKFKNTRIFVTTRPHMLPDLETTLGAFGFNIQPFHEEDQINFLVEFWEFTIQEPVQHFDTLADFARNCLKALNDNMAGAQDIAGVPLQCRLLGELYIEQAERCLHITNSEDNQCMLTSIYQMYSRLMALRFQVAEHQQIQQDKLYFGIKKFFRTLSMEKPWLQKMKEVHYLEAIHLIFPDIFYDVAKTLSIDPSKYLPSREVFDIGLINNNNRFGHRTYAEFLLAEFCVNLMVTDDSQYYPILDLLLEKVFKSHAKVEALLNHDLEYYNNSHLEVNRFDYSDITYFINAILEDRDLTSASTANTVFETKINNIPFIENTLTSCVAANLKHLFSFLTNSYEKLKHVKFDLPVKLLIFAAKCADFKFNIAIYSEVNRHKRMTFTQKLEKRELMTPIQTAINRGNLQVFNVVFNEHNNSGTHLLHYCLFGSLYDKKEVIKDKLDIIDLLSSKQPKLFNDDNDDNKLQHDGSTAILQPYSNLKLITYLLENGAKVNAVTKNNETILHRLIQRRLPIKIGSRDLGNIIRLLREFGFIGYNVANSKGEIPLSMALRTTNLTKRVLRLFGTEGTNFQYRNIFQESLLFNAISHYQPVECLIQLKHWGTKTDSTNYKFETLLHLATSCGHVEAVRFLVTDSCNMVNSKDLNGNTPLHIALTKSSTAHPEIQQILLTHGANISIRNNKGCDPVEHALEYSTRLTITVDRLKDPKSLGYRITKEKARTLFHSLLINQSAISWDIRNNSEFVELLRYLISQGGNVSFNNGEKPTDHKSVRDCISKIVQAFYPTQYPKSFFKDDKNLYDLLVAKVLNDDENNKVIVNQFNSDRISIEFVISVLLCLKDKKSLNMLQKAYQCIPNEYVYFVDINDAELYRVTKKNLCVIFTKCLPLTIAKLQERLDPLIPVVDLESFKNNSNLVNKNIVVIASESESLSFVSSLTTENSRKIIFIKKCNLYVQPDDQLKRNFFSYEDNYTWDGMSKELQKVLLLRFRNQNRVPYYDGKHSFQRLGLLEVLDPDVIPIEFIIPRHVQNSVKAIFGDDLETISTTFSTKLQHAIKFLFPNVRHYSNLIDDKLKISKKLKKAILYGPTASYLVALWTYQNIGMRRAEDIDLITEIFSFNGKNEYVMTIDSKQLRITTFEFKYKLVIYFLDKLLCNNSIPHPARTQDSFAHHFLHSSINAFAPNLLNLFSYPFCLDHDMLHVAAKRGNVHLFHSWRPELKEDDRERYKVYHTSLFAAMHKLHLGDIAYLADVKKTYYPNSDKKGCNRLINICVDNTIRDNLKTLRRKLLALKIIFNNNLLSHTTIKMALKTPANVHPNFVRYLVLIGANPNEFSAVSPSTFVEMISKCSTPEEFHRLIKTIIDNNYVDVLRKRDNHYKLPISTAFRHLEIQEETRELLLKILEKEDLAECENTSRTKTEVASI